MVPILHLHQVDICQIYVKRIYPEFVFTRISKICKKLMHTDDICPSIYPSVYPSPQITTALLMTLFMNNIFVCLHINCNMQVQLDKHRLVKTIAQTYWGINTKKEKGRNVWLFGKLLLRLLFSHHLQPNVLGELIAIHLVTLVTRFPSCTHSCIAINRPEVKLQLWLELHWT